MAQMKPWLIKKDTEEVFVEIYGAKVFLKKLSYGKSRTALDAALKIDSKGQPQLNTGLLATLRTIYQITDWELTDENDEKLPINLHTFDEVLDEKVVEELMSKINEKMGDANGVTEEEKK